MSPPNALRFLFLNQPTTREFFPPQAEGFSIPRMIHQTHRNWDAVPPAIKDSIEKLRERNGGWAYRFYDDAAVMRFIREEYGPAVLTRFERIDCRYGAARADLFRYLLIYRMGGVYMDIKSSVSRPLDEVLRPDDRMVLSQWTKSERFDNSGIHDWDLGGKIDGGELQQWHVMAAPGHPYLHAVIQAVLRNIDTYIPQMHGSGRNGVLRLTGPIAYTLAIIPMLPKNEHRLIEGHEDLGLEYSVFETNAEHKQLFGKHYEDLTHPVVHARTSRQLLSRLYTLFDAARRLKPS